MIFTDFMLIIAILDKIFREKLKSSITGQGHTTRSFIEERLETH